MKIQFLNLSFVCAILLIVILTSSITACSESASSGDSATQTTGKSGSMARFQVIDQYLYTISDSWTLTLFDISDPASPQRWRNIGLQSGIETLHQYNNYLFIGANDGVHIFDNSDPAEPIYVSSFSHVQSCDPVVVQGNFAYATLRSGTNCRFGTNQLDVIDISDITNPRLVRSYPMTSPRGLGIAGTNLFVCDHNKLRTFDISEPGKLIDLDTINADICYDVIPSQGTLLISNANGLSQYDYSRVPLNYVSNIPLSQ